MEYKSLDEIRPKAAIVPAESVPRVLSRRERLERWATALQGHEGELCPLIGMEYRPMPERSAMRMDQTPLSVAYNDPVLRAQGLASDRVGDAKAFVELREAQLHYLLCNCHYGGTMSRDNVAARVRAIASRPTAREVWTRLAKLLRG